jgi:predicted acetyltransferase
VTRTDDAPDLVLDTAALGAIYLGAHTFRQLTHAGRLKECRDGAVSASDRMFASHDPAWSSTMF